MAGYSKRTLVERLGVKPGFRIYLDNSPTDYSQTIGNMPENILLKTTLAGEFDFIQVFSKSRSGLKKRFPTLRERLQQNGMLWVSWPKKASKVTTDLDENVVREIGLNHKMVDVKVCAVDEIWSGLKFVIRLKDRK